MPAIRSGIIDLPKAAEFLPAGTTVAVSGCNPEEVHQMKKLIVGAALLSLMALVSPVWAQPAQQSVHFDPPTCAGTVSMRIHAGATPTFAQVAYAAGDPEAYKVAKLTEAICLACSAPTVVSPAGGCTAIDPGVPGGPFPLAAFDCTAEGFSITKGPGGFDIIVSKYPTGETFNRLNAVQVKEVGCEGFNQQGGSAPPNIFLSICRNGAANGTISLTLDPASPNPDFSVNTTNLSDDAILQAIKGGVGSLGVNSEIIPAGSGSWVPTAHCSQNVLWLQGTNAKPQFGISSTTAFTIVSEGARLNPNVPTLNEWGVILATGLLLLLMYRLHRKRMRRQATT